MTKAANKKGRGLTILLIVLATLTAVALGARIAGVKVFAITTPSMKPALAVGEAVVVCPQRLDKLRPRDVISYYLNEKLLVVTHRIVAIDPVRQTVATKGDNNAEADGVPILYGNIIGKVVFSVPYIGYGLMYLSTVPGKLLVGGAALLLVILLFSRSEKPQGDSEESGGEEK